MSVIKIIFQLRSSRSKLDYHFILFKLNLNINFKMPALIIFTIARTNCYHWLQTFCYLFKYL